MWALWTCTAGVVCAQAVEYRGQSFRDPFTDPGRAGAAAADVPEQEREIASYTVQGILYSPSKPKAIVNGAIVGIGSPLKLGRVERIERDRIIVAYNEKKFILRSKGGTAHGSISKTPAFPAAQDA